MQFKRSSVKCTGSQNVYKFKIIGEVFNIEAYIQARKTYVE
jgi:hypothetical protein